MVSRRSSSWCWALLTAGYAAAATKAIASAPNSSQVTQSVQGELTKSFDGAAGVAKQYPQYGSQITAAAKESFIHGQHWAYGSGIIAVVAGAIVVGVFFPDLEGEKELLASYRRTDSARADMAPAGERAAT